MNINLKLFLAGIYIFCLVTVLYVVFSYLDFKDLSDYSFIKENSKQLIDLKNNNLPFFILVFFSFSVVWVLLLGFGSPIALIGGFIFGSWTGTIISVFSFTIGSSLLYKLSQYYFRNLIIKYLSNRIEKYKFFFKKNEFIYYLIFRLTGGAGIPFAIQNILPVIFDMKLRNYFFATFLGLIPTIFIFASLGAGLQNIISDNEKISYFLLILKPEIYVPIIGFLVILILSFFGRKYFFKNT